MAFHFSIIMINPSNHKSLIIIIIEVILSIIPEEEESIQLILIELKLIIIHKFTFK